MVGLFSRKAISHYVGEWEGDVGEKSGVPGQKPRHLSLQTDVIYRECPETRLEPRAYYCSGYMPLDYRAPEENNLLHK